MRIIVIILLLFSMSSCIERGKAVEKVQQEQKENLTTKKKIAHYLCPNGHQGADQQGKCEECEAVLVHNQAYHGLNIPKDGINDPFGGSSTNTSAASPAQNQYGDYHYICPNGHPGGAATNENCKTCDATLTHNQLYHK